MCVSGADGLGLLANLLRGTLTRKKKIKVNWPRTEDPIAVLGPECLVSCVGNTGKRIWIIPKNRFGSKFGPRPIGFGCDIVGTLYVGDTPKSIGFTENASIAKRYLFQEFRVPIDSWKPCPLIALQKSGPVA